jgi:hypothetical protein
MQLTGVTAIDSIRMAERELHTSPTVRRLWHSMRREWQRTRDRAVASAVSRLDHPGVAEDYRAACGVR